MTVRYQKSFTNQFKKLPPKQRIKVAVIVEIFAQDPDDSVLRNHALKGEWFGYHSISAGGDIRLHYRILDDQTVLFVAVGSHSQLYQ